MAYKKAKIHQTDDAAEDATGGAAAVQGRTLTHRVQVSNFDARLHVLRANPAASALPKEVAEPFAATTGVRVTALADGLGAMTLYHLLPGRGGPAATGPTAAVAAGGLRTALCTIAGHMTPAQVSHTPGASKLVAMAIPRYIAIVFSKLRRTTYRGTVYIIHP